MGQDGGGEKRGPKDPRTAHRYNIFSRLLFCWVDPLFWIGCRRGLEQRDLYAHPREADSERLLTQFNRHWNRELDCKRKGHKPRLSTAILKCFWWRLLIHGLTSSLEVASLVTQSLVLGMLVDYFTIQDPTDRDTRNVILYATGLVLLAVLILLLHGQAFHLGIYTGMLARVTMTAAVYQKVLSLSQMAIKSISIGHVINLASNDVQRFDLAFQLTPYFYIAPIHTAVVTYLVYLDLGWRAFLVIAFLLVLLPVQLILGRLFTHLRFKSVVVTDKRVRIMNEIISGIRVIKMYAWEYAFKKLVTKLRLRESVIILQGGVIRASGAVLMIISLTLFMFVVFSVFTATGGQLSPRIIFTTLSLLITLRLSSVDYVVRNILSMSEIHVAIARLQQLLEMEEIKIHSIEPKAKDKGTGSIHVKVNNVSATWNEEVEGNKMTLHNVSFEVDKTHSLFIVVGPVGAGKSSLLQCLLGELIPHTGSVGVQGHVTYASQEPWVFSGTLRDNILFGRPYNPSWYQTVVEACALNKDIEQLAEGDLTVIGERGATLSGGQKARVNLARAVYHDTDVVILDDPLSAVDVVVAKHIFNKCICGLLRDKLVILVTHQLQFTLQASRILALKEGHVEFYGTPSELLAKGADSEAILGLVTHSEDEREQFSIVDDEDPTDVPPCDSSTIKSATSVASLAVSQTCDDHVDEELTLQLLEDKEQGTISFATYFKYFRAGASITVLLLMMGLFLLGEGGIVVSDWWLSDWAICSQRNITLQLELNGSIPATCHLSTKERIVIYVGVCVAATVLSFARTILFYFICVNASRVLHNRMLSTIFRAPVRFFDTNPVGRILNRFSKDVGFLDDLLPFIFTEYFLLSWRVAAIIVVSVASSVWVLIPATSLVLAFIVLRAYFLKTAREVKRLEAIARSPVYSHLSVTLQGLTTVRALKKEATMINLFHKYHNEHSQGWYLYIATGRWFGLRIDILSAMFLAVVVVFSVLLSSNLNPALVGLVLTYVVSLMDLLQYSVRQSTEVENNMVSAERIMGYCRLQSEASLETLAPNISPPPGWPEKGEIVMEDVSFRYSSDLPLVLKDLSLTIDPGEKVGVVGRTGAGKSSLISVLYRLAEPCGHVTINGIDTKTIGLHDLRRNISIIPQDPVLFTGTMRYNLDPFDEYSNAQLWEALEQVQLKPAVQQLSGGLDGEVSEGGNNFSVGQRQLVCLARALLKKNTILILDEATANVDIKTDEIIQQTIREKFMTCTTITIAHRLNTVMDSDRIMVMNKGQLKEFDSPYNLLQNPQSLLHDMVKKTGPSASRQLQQMALAAHLTKQQLRT